MAESAASVVTVNVTEEDAGVSEEGFGVDAFACYHTVYTDRIREYRSANDVALDGFAAGHPAVFAARAHFAQSPHAPILKIIRLTTPVAPVHAFKVIDTSTADVVGWTVYGLDGVAHEVTTVVTLGQTAAQVAAALKVISDALGLGYTSAVVGDTLTMTTAVAGTKFHITNLRGVEMTDSTPDAHVANDLIVTQDIDDDWYGLATQYHGATNIAAIAAWASTQSKLYFSQGSDAADINANNTGVSNTLHVAGDKRQPFTATRYLAEYRDVAWMASMFTILPGGETWAHKTLIGITPDKYSATQRANLSAKGANWYSTIQGRNVTRWGTVPSGDFIDTTRFTDWLKARHAEAVFGTLASRPKVKQTNAGLQVLVAKMDVVNAQGVTQGGFDDDPRYAPTAWAPDISEISDANRSIRNAAGLKFKGRLANAIHTVEIDGTVSI